MTIWPTRGTSQTLDPFSNCLLPSPAWLRWWISGKEFAYQCRRHEFNPWVGKILWRRNGNPLQYSCLENSRDSRAWWATVRGVTKSGTWLCNQATTTLLLIESSSFYAHNLSSTHVLLNLHCLYHSLGWAFLALLNFWLSNTTCRILVSRPGIEPSPAAAEAWSLNHWPPRDVPLAFLMLGVYASSLPSLHLLSILLHDWWLWTVNTMMILLCLNP